MPKLKCPWCGKSGQTVGEKALFEIRGRDPRSAYGWPIMKCLECDNGLVAKPRLFPPSRASAQKIDSKYWSRMESAWEEAPSKTPKPGPPEDGEETSEPPNDFATIFDSVAEIFEALKGNADALTSNPEIFNEILNLWGEIRNEVEDLAAIRGDLFITEEDWLKLFEMKEGVQAQIDLILAASETTSETFKTLRDYLSASLADMEERKRNRPWISSTAAKMEEATLNGEVAKETLGRIRDALDAKVHLSQAQREEIFGIYQEISDHHQEAHELLIARVDSLKRDGFVGRLPSPWDSSGGLRWGSHESVKGPGRRESSYSDHEKGSDTP